MEADRQLRACADEGLDLGGNAFDMSAGSEVQHGINAPLWRPRLPNYHMTLNRPAPIVCACQGELAFEAPVLLLALEASPSVR